MNHINESLYLPQKRSGAINFIVNAALILAVFLLVVEIVFGLLFTPFYIVNISMTPTLTGAKDQYTAGGDYVYIDRRATPDYGDIVVMYDEDGQQNIIKRVIAFGGDTVKLERGQLYIKYAGSDEFIEIDEYYLADGYNSPNEKVNTFAAYTVAEGEVFLMGDNRNRSTDSRAHGGYPLENLVGVVTGWSLTFKAPITAVQTFFHFTLPQAFGL